MTISSSRKYGRDSARRLRLRLALLGLASTLVYLSVVARLTGRPVLLRWGFPLTDFLVIFFLMYFIPLFLLAMAAAWWTFQGDADDPASLGLILGFAILFRLLLLPAPPVLSSDIFRYVWDARIQASGINPYLSRPADFANIEEARRDPLYLQQNRPNARTIYPPLAQAAFRGVRAVAGESVTAMKGLMLAGDLVTLALLAQLLTSLGLPRNRVIVYAWHPLTVFEVAGSGHLDTLAVPFILLAILAWRRDRNVAAGAALGGAALMKIFPVLLLPAFFSRRRWPMLVGCGATVLLGYLPFLPEAGSRVLGHLPQFLADPGEVFNPSIMGLAVLLLSGVSPAPVYWASWIGRGALLAVLAWLLRGQPDTPQDLLARIWIVAGAFTLLTLTLHPWYLLWLLPLLAIQAWPAWIYLSGAVAVSYLSYLVTPPTRVLLGLLEYVPFFLLLCWQWRRHGAFAPVAAGPGFAREIP
jgi:alpha-1,6-mannosyltransferase